jgi:hypothetical protein
MPAFGWNRPLDAPKRTNSFEPCLVARSHPRASAVATCICEAAILGDRTRIHWLENGPKITYFSGPKWANREKGRLEWDLDKSTIE